MKKKNLIFSLVVAGIISGCNSSSNNQGQLANSETGYLIDNVVKGIKYQNGDNVGFTNDDGSFTYKGGAISFYLGNIKLGEVNSLPSDKKVFLQDLLAIDRTNIQDENLLKVGTLLQTIDEDKTTEKIDISEDTFNKFNLEQKIDNIKENFEVNKVLSDAGFEINSIKSIDEVKEHILTGLEKNKGIEDVRPPKVEEFVNLISVNENTSAITKIKAKDSNPLEFSLEGEDVSMFNIDKETGELSLLINNLKDPQKNQFSFNVVVSDGKNITKKNIVIQLNKEQKEQVVENKTNLSFSVPETIKIKENNFFIEFEEATSNSPVKYSVEGPNSQLFSINETTGELKFISAPDFEANINNVVNIIIVAEDVNGYKIKKQTSIEIENIENEIIPVITSNNSAQINKNFNNSDVLYKAEVNSGSVVFSILGDHKDLFDINSTTGEIKFKEGLSISNEIGTRFNINVVATEENGSSSYINVSFVISDIEETKPAPIITSPSEIFIQERTTLAYTATTEGEGTITYSFDNTVEDDKDFFNLDPVTGVITFKALSDFELQESYKFKLIASNGVNQSVKDITINLTNIVDESYPQLINDNGAININENVSGNIYNYETNKPVKFKITNLNDNLVEKFELNENTGELRLIEPINVDDSENIINETVVRLEIEIEDEIGQKNNYFQMIYIKDIPDEKPKIILSNEFIIKKGETDFDVLIPEGNTLFDLIINPDVYSIASLEPIVIDGPDKNDFQVLEDLLFRKKIQILNPMSFGDVDKNITIIATDTAGNTNSFNLTIKATEVLNKVTFQGITYGEIVSSKTGRTWLDRNLGATEKCISKIAYSIYECYGDFYQWGRLKDGHQLKFSSLSENKLSINDISNRFISGIESWVSDDDYGVSRLASWNSICPSGYRVPTKEEFEAEINGLSEESNLLHNTNIGLIYGGSRTTKDNFFYQQYDEGGKLRALYWTSSSSELNKAYALSDSIGDFYQWTVNEHAPNDELPPSIISIPETYGANIRCIKN